MMMISANVDTGDEDTRRLFPADRCSFTSDYIEANNAYLVQNAQFYPGAGTAIAGVSVHEAVLGFMGKSGRFVGTTNNH